MKGGNQTLMNMGNQSFQNIMINNNDNSMQYASTTNGLKVDSFYID